MIEINLLPGKKKKKSKGLGMTLPEFGELMVMSMSASGNPHPAGLSMWKSDSDWEEGFTQMGEDWVLSAKIGDAQLSIIVVGINPHDQ